MKGGVKIMLWCSRCRKNDRKWELVLADGFDIICRSGIISKNQVVITQMVSFMNDGLKGNLTTDICETLNYMKVRKY